MKCAIQDVMSWPETLIRNNYRITEVDYKDFINGSMRPGAYFITGYSDSDFDELERKVHECQNSGGLVLYFTMGGLNSLKEVVTPPMTRKEVSEFIHEGLSLENISERL